MSRSASKSRTETRGPKASVPAAPPQSPGPPVEEGLVPGPLTQTQWQALLRLEETGGPVRAVVEELVGGAMERCLQTHVGQQVTHGRLPRLHHM